MQKRGLGKGLSALIVNTESSPPEQKALPNAVSESVAGVQMVALAEIQPNPAQPRVHFEEGALAELAASIREHGIIQPLIVTKSPDGANGTSGRYWLIAGERRWRAAQLAEQAEVPVLVREATPQQRLELALIENIQRADLNPLEEAAAYQALIDDFGLIQQEVAERVGKSRSAVTNTIRLLQLPPAAQAALSEQAISAGHARALLSLAPNNVAILETLEEIVQQGLTVRQAEALVRIRLNEGDGGEEVAEAIGEEGALEEAPQDERIVTHLVHMEDRLRSALGTRVKLNRNQDGSGRLVVHFFNDLDLEAIYHLIAGEET